MSKSHVDKIIIIMKQHDITVRDINRALRLRRELAVKVVNKGKRKDGELDEVYIDKIKDMLYLMELNDIKASNIYKYLNSKGIASSKRHLSFIFNFKTKAKPVTLSNINNAIKALSKMKKNN